MLALYFDGEAVLREVEDAKPGPGEALIKVDLAGFCRTDIEITQGYMAFRGVLGHEFVGTVQESESWPELVGRRVVGEINIRPGVEDENLRKHDPARSVLGILDNDGCFAEKICLPVENLHAVPEVVPDRAAVFTEPLAAALEIPEQVYLKPTDNIAVVGDGKLGLLAARVLVLKGNAVTVVGKHERKLEIAHRYGAAAKYVEEFTAEPYEVVVDCSGRPEGLKTSLSLLRPRGTLVLKTTTAAPPDFHTSQLVIDEITVVGSRCGPFAPALRLLALGLVDVEPLIEAVYPLEKGVEALEHAKRPGTLKVLLDMNG